MLPLAFPYTDERPEKSSVWRLRMIFSSAAAFGRVALFRLRLKMFCMGFLNWVTICLTMALAWLISETGQVTCWYKLLTAVRTELIEFNAVLIGPLTALRTD